MEEKKYITITGQDVTQYVKTVEDRRTFRKLCASETAIKENLTKDLTLEILRMTNLYNKLLGIAGGVFIIPYSGDVRDN